MPDSSGPFASPYATSVSYDKLVLVASGIGITPAMDCMHSLADNRRVNLIWVCRDASLLEFYLDGRIEFDDDAWSIIYYSGKRKLVLPASLPKHLVLIEGRPNFEKSIFEIIGGIETGAGLPEDVLHDSEVLQAHLQELADGLDEGHVRSLAPEARLRALLKRSLQTFTSDEFFEVLEEAAGGRGGAEGTEIPAGGFAQALEAITPGSFTASEASSLFRSLDTDGSGSLGLAEFEAFCQTVFAEMMVEEP